MPSCHKLERKKTSKSVGARPIGGYLSTTRMPGHSHSDRQTDTHTHTHTLVHHITTPSEAGQGTNITSPSASDWEKKGGKRGRGLGSHDTIAENTTNTLLKPRSWNQQFHCSFTY